VVETTENSTREHHVDVSRLAANSKFLDYKCISTSDLPNKLEFCQHWAHSTTEPRWQPCCREASGLATLSCQVMAGHPSTCFGASCNQLVVATARLSSCYCLKGSRHIAQRLWGYHRGFNEVVPFYTVQGPVHHQYWGCRAFSLVACWGENMADWQNQRRALHLSSMFLGGIWLCERQNSEFPNRCP
jgi:hypothetical protein